MKPLLSLSTTRKLGILILLMNFTGSVYANGLSETYFTDKNPKLTKQERSAINISKKWQGNSASNIGPTHGEDGSVRFVFGAQQPSIVCAVLQVCDVELQPGETVNSVHVGDQARWIIEPAITGQGTNKVQHLIIKPMDVGLETSLVATTNRRSYHMRLRSHRSEFMSRVGFIYPDEANEKWQALKERNAYTRHESTSSAENPHYLSNLDFNYSVEGNADWKPVRVYNDGQKTVIEMPKAMTQTEAPALLLLSREGWLFRDEETAIVNYRLQGERYIVDTLFDKAILVSGISGNQSRVTIRRERKL